MVGLTRAVDEVLSSSEEAVTYEATLRLAIKDLDESQDALVPLSRLLNQHIPDDVATRRPVLRAMRDHVLTHLGTSEDADDLRTTTLRALDSFLAVHVIGARAKASAFFDKLIRETGWFRIALVAGSSVAEAAFLAVNHPKKTLTVIDAGPLQPGRALTHKLAWQTQVPVRYAPLCAAHRAVEGVDAVIMGAEEIMTNGCVMVAPGGAVVAHAAAEAAVPVIITTQTVKFSDRALVDWFVDGDILRPREIQAIVTELDTNAWRPTFMPDVLKKMGGERG